MHEYQPLMAPSRSSRMDKVQALLEILLVSGVLSSLLASLLLSSGSESRQALVQDPDRVIAFLVLEASITLVLLLVLLKARRETLTSLGVSFNRFTSHGVIGLGIVPVLFLANFLIAALFRILLPQYALERNPLIEIIQTPRQLVLFVMAAILAGGIKEELQRAFILLRFREHLGGARLGLLLWSLAFGAGHYVQGVQGIVTATLFGFLLGAVYLVRRNLIAPMVSHALYDTLALVGYWFLRP